MDRLLPPVKAILSIWKVFPAIICCQFCVIFNKQHRHSSTLAPAVSQDILQGLLVFGFMLKREEPNGNVLF